MHLFLRHHPDHDHAEGPVRAGSDGQDGAGDRTDRESGFSGDGGMEAETAGRRLPDGHRCPGFQGRPGEERRHDAERPGDGRGKDPGITADRGGYRLEGTAGAGEEDGGDPPDPAGAAMAGRLGGGGYGPDCGAGRPGESAGGADRGGSGTDGGRQAPGGREGRNEGAVRYLENCGASAEPGFRRNTGRRSRPRKRR